MNTRKLTLMSILLSFSLVIYVIESSLMPIVPIPAVKLGLANVITLISMVLLGKREAFTILMLRIIISSIFYGGMSGFLYSFSGGMLCFIIEALIINFFSQKQLFIVSVTGAIFHNAGQVLVAFLITKTPAILYYMIPLTVSAIITGVFIGLVSSAIISHSKKILNIIYKS